MWRSKQARGPWINHLVACMGSRVSKKDQTIEEGGGGGGWLGWEQAGGDKNRKESSLKLGDPQIMMNV